MEQTFTFTSSTAGVLEIGITAANTDAKPAPWAPDQYRPHYEVELVMAGRPPVTFDFWGNLVSTPEPVEMLLAYGDDAMTLYDVHGAGDGSPADELDAFNDEMGYTSPSEAIRAYKGCRRAFEQMCQLLPGRSTDEAAEVLLELGQALRDWEDADEEERQAWVSEGLPVDQPAGAGAGAGAGPTPTNNPMSIEQVLRGIDWEQFRAQQDQLATKADHSIKMGHQQDLELYDGLLNLLGSLKDAAGAAAAAAAAAELDLEVDL